MTDQTTLVTAQTYQEVRTEVNQVERKARQKRLVDIQRAAEKHITTRTNAVETAKRNLEHHKQVLAKAEAALTEITTNVRAFVERVETVGNQETISQRDVNSLSEEGAWDLNLTAEEKERAITATQNVRRVADAYQERISQLHSTGPYIQLKGRR